MSLRQRIRSAIRAKPKRSCIRLKETVVFFPTAGRLVENVWRVPVHGRIYKPVEFSRLRRAGLGLMNRLVGRKLEGAAASTASFRKRMAEFLADNERGNRIQIRVDEAVFTLRRSRAGGHFRGNFDVPAAMHNAGSWVTFSALTRPEDRRSFEGRAQLLPPEGLSVISDIDDTIKITEVLHKRQMLYNTFVRDFACVPGMAALYRRWADQRGAAFHYVSASPWHLYPFLAEFLAAHAFPAGSWHLRDFRLMGVDLVRTLQSSRRIKWRHAQRLLKEFPRRKFVLVGDSGESDPEIYARLARVFPGQVERILIRSVTDEPADAARWTRTFAGLPRAPWRVFVSTDEIMT